MSFVLIHAKIEQVLGLTVTLEVVIFNIYNFFSTSYAISTSLALERLRSVFYCVLLLAYCIILTQIENDNNAILFMLY